MAIIEKKIKEVVQHFLRTWNHTCYMQLKYATLPSFLKSLISRHQSLCKCVYHFHRNSFQTLTIQQPTTISLPVPASQSIGRNDPYINERGWV